jgi:hypothetical protein
LRGRDSNRIQLSKAVSERRCAARIAGGFSFQKSLQSSAARQGKQGDSIAGSENRFGATLRGRVSKGNDPIFQNCFRATLRDENTKGIKLPKVISERRCAAKTTRTSNVPKSFQGGAAR